MKMLNVPSTTATRITKRPAKSARPTAGPKRASASIRAIATDFLRRIMRELHGILSLDSFGGVVNLKAHRLRRV
jgi:hypothetical protein